MYVRGKKMIEKNTRICNLMKRIINVITAVMAVVIAQIISENFLDGSLLWTVIIMVVFFVIFAPLGLFIGKKIDDYYDKKCKVDDLGFKEDYCNECV